MISKNIIITLSVVVVVAVLIGGYFLLGTMNKPENSQNQLLDNQEQTGNQNEEQLGKKMAFLDFVKQGGSYECEVNQLVSNIETKGHVYISNGMIRGEYNTMMQGMNVDSHMIIRDEYVYTWNSIMPTAGSKMKIHKGSNALNGSDDEPYINSQFGDYNCQPWSADQSQFTVPANITFHELAI